MQPSKESKKQRIVLKANRVMMRKFLRILPIVFFCVVFIQPSAVAAAATSTVQSQIDAASAEIQTLQAQITQYEDQLTKLGSQKETLQSAIQSLDLQRKKVNASISVTQTKINQTSLKLTDLGGSIDNKTQRIASNQTSIATSLRAIEHAEGATIVEQIFSAGGFDNAWQDIAKLTTLDEALRNDTMDLQSTKASLTSDYNATQQTQNELMALRKQLSQQETELNQNRAQQAALLAQTKNSEATYQTLLAEAKSQLASFSAFAQNAGGSGLLANQTSCDSWGCYYNQRDAAWGNLPLNGTKYRLASDGCLVTAMAMVMTHYGYMNVTPATINANPSNFAAYYPAYLLFTVQAGGATAVRVRQTVSTRTIDALLKNGPVIVGIYAYGGTHFVVLTKNTGTDYLMRDPYVANGKDISFSAHYKFNNIYAVNTVVIKK
jgi:peptidoglycan hydrolase CwlO-like protein